jgi:hypothetical protein
MPQPSATLAMHPQAALLQRLRELKQGAQERDVESAAVRASWLEAVDTLLRALRGWLERAAAEELLRVDLASVHVADDAVGAYDAPALKITLPGPRVVWIRPVGTLCVGARGIVDIVCGSNRALLVLNRAGIWKIRGVATGTARQPRKEETQHETESRSPLVPLDESEFARALTELIL